MKDLLCISFYKPVVGMPSCFFNDFIEVKKALYPQFKYFTFYLQCSLLAGIMDVWWWLIKLIEKLKLIDCLVNFSFCGFLVYWVCSLNSQFN